MTYGQADDIIHLLALLVILLTVALVWIGCVVTSIWIEMGDEQEESVQDVDHSV